MMAWWHSLSLETLTRLNGTLVACTALAGAAVGVGGVLIWFTTSRIEELKGQADAMAAAERRAAEAKLLEQIRQADNRATDAEARAGSATQRAEQAHALANRHVPRPLSPDAEASVVALLRTLLSKRRQITLDLVFAGTDDPVGNHVAMVVARLLHKAEVVIGRTGNIGMAVGLPRGALIFADPVEQNDAESLATALRPAIANVSVQIRPGTRLTLHLNGRPSFNADGSFALE